MDTLRVRLYNVRFGDAVLITVPDRGAGKKVTERNILIDVGNSFHGVGGEDAVFGPVVEDVLKVLDGKPLDLYIMTHEHMDHVQGLLQVDQKVLPGHDLKARLNVQYAWLTASAEPGYYEKPGHEAAKSQFRSDAQPVCGHQPLPGRRRRGSHPGADADVDQQSAFDGRLRGVFTRPGRAGTDHLYLSRLQSEEKAPLPRGEVRDLGARGEHRRLLWPILADELRHERGRCGRRGG